MGVHAFVASHIASRPADLSWSDADLRAYFKKLKGEEPVIYDTAKRVVHMSNYLGTARKMHYEWPETFKSIKAASRLQDLYFELFPEIRVWHRELCQRVDASKQRVKDEVAQTSVDPWTLGVCFAQNPFGYVHRFYNVLDWEKVENEWHWSYGEDAKRLVSFLPQSTAAAIIKRATKRIWAGSPTVGDSLRLLIHDEILGEAKEEEIEECLEVSRKEMEAPILELPLDPSWEMGEYLSIGTEAKVGPSWAAMH